MEKISARLMPIIAWLIKTFHIYLRKFELRGLRVAIILVSIPLALNASCIVIFIFYLIIPELFFKTGFLGTAGLVFLNYILINTYLEDEYVKKKNRKIEGGYYLLFYLISPLYFVGSVWLFIFFFRFL